MSWEHNHYLATCAGCGREGECIRSSDDWNRTETRYVGFTNKAPDAVAVAQKRVGSGDMSPVCPMCGSTEIRVGRLLKTT